MNISEIKKKLKVYKLVEDYIYKDKLIYSTGTIIAEWINSYGHKTTWIMATKNEPCKKINSITNHHLLYNIIEISPLELNKSIDHWHQEFVKDFGNTKFWDWNEILKDFTDKFDKDQEKYNSRINNNERIYKYYMNILIMLFCIFCLFTIFHSPNAGYFLIGYTFSDLLNFIFKRKK